VGQNSLFLNNCNVGNGSVVAGGAVVIRDVPNDVLVAGVPALIKKELPVDDGVRRNL